MSYLDWIKQHERVREAARRGQAFGDDDEAGSVGGKGGKGANSPDRSQPGLAACAPGARIGRELGVNPPEPLEVRPLAAPPLLPDRLEASWRALSAPDDLFPDQPGECSVCGAAVEYVVQNPLKANLPDWPWFGMNIPEEAL